MRLQLLVIAVITSYYSNAKVKVKCLIFREKLTTNLFACWWVKTDNTETMLNCPENWEIS